MDAQESDGQRGKLVEDSAPILLSQNNPKKVTNIKTSLQEPLKEKLIVFLQENDDVFAWTAADMLGIDPQLKTHKYMLILQGKMYIKKTSLRKGKRPSHNK